jgi:hypothetical protein
VASGSAHDCCAVSGSAHDCCAVSGSAHDCCATSGSAHDCCAASGSCQLCSVAGASTVSAEPPASHARDSSRIGAKPSRTYEAVYGEVYRGAGWSGSTGVAQPE